LSSDLAQTLRRIKPEKRVAALKPRDLSSLAFLGRTSRVPSKLLYDTTVYIDILQGRFPRDAEVFLRATDAWHSTVTDAELVAAIGFLDPKHPDTAKVVKHITETIERRPTHRTIAPDRELWLEAGVLSGLLARLQDYGAADRRRALNDALLFATARKHGLTVLTRNTKDFDLLQQLEPACGVLFYEQSR
jgi:predicted nucleic acid-binding protein